MEEYISESGDLFTVDKINQIAKDNNTTFESIVKMNKLALKSKKQEDKKEVPGKRKSVAKEDAGATVKSTVSKPAKSSSELQSNIWGEDRSKPDFLEKIQKVSQPKVKFTKPVDIVKPKQDLKLISEYQDNLKKEEESTFSNYLKESFDSGVSTIVKSFYKAPEYIYNAAAVFTNPVADLIGNITGVETKDASSERIMETFGIKNVPADILQERISKSDKVIQEYSTKNGVDPLTAIQNGNYLGAAKLIAGGTIQSSPMMAAAMLSGGSSTALAGISASTAISKADQLQRENPEMDVQTRTVNAAVSGLLEGYLGSLFTGASGAVVKKILVDKGTKAGAKIVSNGLMNTLETAIEKNPMIGALGEVAEESAVELGNQLNDINSGIRNELDYRAITNAGIIATGMAGTNTIPVYGAKGYMKAVEYNQVKSVNKEINTLTNQLSNPYISDSDKKIISSRVNRLVDENKAIVGSSLEKISVLPENIKTEINTINTDLDDIKSKYLELSDNDAVSIDVKQAMGEELKLQAKTLFDRKNSIIEGNYVYEDFRKLPIEEQTRIKDIANQTLIADSELNDTPKTNFNEDEINREAINIYNAELRTKDIATDIGRTKAAVKAVGLGEEVDMPELNSSNDVIDYLSANTELDENTIEDIAESYGAFIPLPNGKEALIINKEAADMDQVVTTGQHEFLHKLIYKAVKGNADLQKQMGLQLYNHIENYIGTEEFNNTEFKSRYDGYKADFESTKSELDNKVLKAEGFLNKGLISQERYDQAVTEATNATAKAEGKYLEEVLPLLSESLTKGDVKYNETFFTKIGDILRRVFQKYGLSKVKFNTGQDVFDFVRDYNKSFEKGQFTKAFKALAKEGTYKGSIAKGNVPAKTTSPKTEVKLSKAQIENLNQDLKKLEDEYDEGYGDIDEQEYKDRKANIEAKIKTATKLEEKGTVVKEVKKETTEEDEVKEIIKNERSSLSSDKVQQIYKAKGKSGAAEIIKLFKPITNKIVDKRRDAPGFDRELLTDEIETGVGGILDLITKYKPESGIPLAAYINKYLPVRAIATSRRVLDQQFNKDASEEKGLIATETADQVFAETAKEKPKYNNALESKVFEPEALETINAKILTVVRILKTKINEPVSLNKTVTPIIAEIRDEIGKQVDIDVKTAMGGKKDNQLKNWLLKNKKYVLENMTTTWMMGKDGQGGMPIAIQKQVDGRWINFPEWVGKKIDREKTTTDQAGRTSGAELVRRLPSVNNNISDADYLAQVIGPDGNPLRGRKESLAKAIAEESTFDIINDDLQNKGPIYDALEANQKRLTVDVLDNLANEFAKQAERGNIKFSNIIKGAHISFNKLNKDISNAKTIEEEAKVISDWIASDGRSLRTIAAMVGSTLESFTTNKSLFYNVILKSIEANSKFKGLIRENSYRLGDVYRGQSIFFGEEKVPLWKDIDQIKANFERNAPVMEKEAIEATERLFNIINDFKAKGISNYNFKAYIQFLRQDQRGLIRKLSKPGIAVLGMSKKQKPHLEHNMPVQAIVEKIFDFYDGKIAEDGLREFIGNGRVNLVPDNFNSILPNYKEGKNRMEDPAVLLEIQGLLDKGYTVYNIKGEYGSKANFSALVKLAQSKVNSKESIQNIYNTIAINKSLDIKESKVAKGISVFDFDDTIGLTKGSVLYTMPNGSKGKLNAEEFAKKGSNMLNAGAIFDFSEFSKVVDGKPGPMVDKMKKMIGKFGPDSFFILTARPANASGPIHEFLTSIGINIPLENITGLGNSTAQAKADWMTAKAAEGYNDFYFSDDAIQNVTAVKNALEVLDVKSKIQQARIKFSKSISPEFNRIISKNTGIGPAISYSDIVAKRKGAGKNLFDLYVPASAADFELLLYNFIGKGKEGEAQKEFFTDALLKPYANGNDLMDAARQSIKNNYKDLIKSFPNVAKKLEKLTPDGNFTYDQALRVAMWNGSDVEIPGLSKTDTKNLTSLIKQDLDLSAFMSGLITLGRQGNGWTKPGEYWDSSTIISDLHNLTEGDGRKQFLTEFIDNAEQMFGKWENGKLVGPNINKVEAIYGTDVREAIEDVLYRMTTGKNRSQGKDKITNKWFNWVSGSTGTIMFLNTRSATLQLIGAVNFLNLRDNNPISAGIAFANQPQYWKDFSRIWNSDKMKERRGGLKEDVAAAEIANAAATSRNKPVAVVSYLLKIGYTPTQIADSFAIASGGAPFYRNRIKTYLKEGQTEDEAEKNAWNDFTKVSDETQQSGDPRDISKQQASGAGRLLLTFQNTAMQQSRIVKKSFLDLKNGRGNPRTHITKIAYYLAIQNLMFSALQQGLFAVLPGLGYEEDDDEKEYDKEKQEAEKKRIKEKDKKIIEITNGVVDSIVRGTGLLGGVMVTVKNVIKKYMEEAPKEYKADYAKVLLEAVNISPPIGSKLRKAYTGLQQTKFERDLIKERGWGVMQDGRVHLGPMYSVTGKAVEATTNFPMDRLVTKIENASQAMNSQNEAWQRVMVGMGWTPRSVGIGETSGDIAIEATAKEVRKEEGKIKGQETRQRTKDSIRSLPMSERIKLKREAAIKRREEKLKKRERMKKRKMG